MSVCSGTNTSSPTLHVECDTTTEQPQQSPESTANAIRSRLFQLRNAERIQQDQTFCLHPLHQHLSCCPSAEEVSSYPDAGSVFIEAGFGETSHLLEGPLDPSTYAFSAVPPLASRLVVPRLPNTYACLARFASGSGSARLRACSLLEAREPQTNAGLGLSTMEAASGSASRLIGPCKAQTWADSE
ncbi:hypothetical protein GE21DRAFT_9617 [Neurospora crassa]|uniref:Uncharacterized protein n=1 Tax=Neurospora crassa (strain ATCC 24698 / 74-OR23-1A / CBS 708.71 / DSM 1257 / FGSC 987) TaxID=367110 RepID=A7UW21_NEUCR|nr:hypothetical protein NCU10537 [Neurospora crassa OR74A]EDO65362.1 hypothetical protein NCU10537 [Neurospora crassa OR74A]KHE78585.1 hypothetical protein GE21DRAFT_9617 [Neurospora crassa]|eukprot:XP_001728453.1 hypothetical protein NCU10537 [Neurospora crassa OR74A]